MVQFRTEFCKFVMYVTLLAMCIGDALRHYILYRKELGDFEIEESSMRMNKFSNVPPSKLLKFHMIRMPLIPSKCYSHSTMTI
jgi:hypothetical protein